MEKTYEKEIEAILFYKGEPVSKKDLARMVALDEDSLNKSLRILSDSLSMRGIVLVDTKDEVSLATSPDVSDLLSQITKDEINRDLSQASMETLAIVVYKAPITRKDIEYIRGVNCTFSIRNLLIRGLIERTASALDERIFLYKPTTDLLLHLGIKSFDELPEWKEIQKELNKKVEQNPELVDSESEE